MSDQRAGQQPSADATEQVCRICGGTKEEHDDPNEFFPRAVPAPPPVSALRERLEKIIAELRTNAKFYDEQCYGDDPESDNVRSELSTTNSAIANTLAAALKAGTEEK